MKMENLEMVNVYRKYDFQYDEKRFMNNFKNTIVDKGYVTLSLFHELLKTFGINSYDTACSYYNKRKKRCKFTHKEQCITYEDYIRIDVTSCNKNYIIYKNKVSNIALKIKLTERTKRFIESLNETDIAKLTIDESTVQTLER
jgi:hypothetical protein